LFAYGQVRLIYTLVCLFKNLSDIYVITDQSLWQTGSGKTYTMMGELSKEGDELNNESGLTPRIFEYLFARIKEVRCLYARLII
jgi:hypothetical protein